MKTIKLIPVLLIAMLLSACTGFSPAAPTATPVDVGALQTAVVQTVVANITETAAAQPAAAATDTPVPAAAVTDTPVALDTATPTEAPTTPALCDNSAFVSDASVADGTHMGPNQAFIKTWRVKNIGTCTWSTAYHVTYGFGDKMSGVSTPLTAAVLPGAEVEISINLTAPAKAGNYFANWKLTNGNGVFFGQGLTIMIVVP